MEVNVDQSLNVSNGPEVIIHRKSSAPSRLLTNLTNAIWFLCLNWAQQANVDVRMRLRATLEGKTANIAHMHSVFSESESNQSVTCHL